MSADLRVLLLSPVHGLDPPNGDVTYTEQLLAHPPSGVSYVPYDVALESGKLREKYRRKPGERSSERARSDSRTKFAVEIAVNKLRRAGILFREPFRHFEIDPSAFDLIHAHVFSVGIEPSHVPLIVGNSITVDAVYQDGRGASPFATALRRHVDGWLAARTRVAHSSYEQHGADAVICFSDFLRDRFIDQTGQRDRYYVVPPGIDLPPAPPAGSRSGPFVIGFVGDWNAKGGDLVLSAHRQLRERGLDSTLVVVGSEPRLPDAESAELQITWLPRQPRETLLREIAPKLSVFAYPSRFDGLPLTLLEMMGSGVPAIVSDYGALPEVVNFGQAGTVIPVNDGGALREALLRLTDLEPRAAIGRAGRKRVEEAYSSGVTSERLGEVYRQVLGA